MILLVPMSEAEFTAYAAESIPEYAHDKVRSGQWAEADALELSRKGLAEMLPREWPRRTTISSPCARPRAPSSSA